MSAVGPRRVLVVDDDPAIRFVCRFNLDVAGIEVLEAGDGEQALDILRDETVDLVLLDVMMPRRDGWEVASELASLANTPPPVVFLTARAEQADRRRAVDLGAVGYVTKPFDPVELVEGIPRILDAIERGERDRLRSEILGEEA
jgi:two-component system response regulator VicR